MKAWVGEVLALEGVELLPPPPPKENREDPPLRLEDEEEREMPKVERLVLVIEGLWVRDGEDGEEGEGGERIIVGEERASTGNKRRVSENLCRQVQILLTQEAERSGSG